MASVYWCSRYLWPQTTKHKLEQHLCYCNLHRGDGNIHWPDPESEGHKDNLKLALLFCNLQCSAADLNVSKYLANII